MTATLLVRHTVDSYDDWKHAFDGHEATRRQHGATGHRVLHDGNQVTVLIDFPDRGSAEEFASDSALPEAMRKGGVTGSPEIAYLDSSEQLSY
ncbi:hypothetical protein [Intrasporangium sp. YIM S08009]|uniref:hypothetical protein n=1 Tax=Intrasporangium zincisolvens TaxID=3080018 RepID=UPI002B05C7F0|nr:hypothetical protein [Intrasporangium sp. YIM S08009]